MRRALANKQVLLAWCGWPPPHELSWGVMHAVDNGHFRGCVAGDPALERAHSGTAYQVYVLEEIAPLVWPPGFKALGEVYRESAGLRRRPTASTPADLMLGVPAISAWREVLNISETRAAATDGIAQVVAQLSVRTHQLSRWCHAAASSISAQELLAFFERCAAD
jgi:hypothetical protein